MTNERLVSFRQATLSDVDTISNLGLLLYSSDNTFEKLRDEAKEHLLSGKWAIFLAYNNANPIGFCEISLRYDYVEGTEGGIVGYIEGVFVLPEFRNQHIAKSLIKFGENWSRERGCIEFASDCMLDNADSLRFHLQIGFKEVGRNIHFVKKLRSNDKCITLLYGTSNTAKLEAMRQHIKGLPIAILGLKDIEIELPEIDESGSDPLENARIKAYAYHKATGLSTFSCDSGLYIEDAPDEVQPGVHVRSVVGDGYLNDDEMIEHYAKLAESMGGNITVQYKNGICLVMSNGEIFEYMGDDIAGEQFILTSKPHKRLTPGFPLDSLSVHIETGKYYYDMDELKDRSSMDAGFRAFFERVLEEIQE